MLHAFKQINAAWTVSYSTGKHTLEMELETLRFILDKISKLSLCNICQIRQKSFASFYIAFASQTTLASSSQNTSEGMHWYTD